MVLGYIMIILFLMSSILQNDGFSHKHIHHNTERRSYCSKFIAYFTKSIAHAIYKVFIIGSDVFEYDQVEPFIVNNKNVEIRYWNSNLGHNNSIKIKKGQEKKIIKHWIPGLPLKVIIHGWLDSFEHEDGVFRIKTAYIRNGGFNIITVDWGDIARKKNYMFPALMTTKIGTRVSEILDNIVKLGIIQPIDMHLIGHSLGAHIAGVCGSNIKSGQIGRITGLDPARPGFEFAKLQKKGLKKTDAAFVDVIHTSGGFTGCSQAMGHIDFFPNGGKSPQPGCIKNAKSLSKVINSVRCSHSRAYQLYEDSIYNAKSMMATACPSWDKYKNQECNNNIKIPMGHDISLKEEGNFYLLTQESAPFGLEENQKEDL